MISMIKTWFTKFRTIKEARKYDVDAPVLSPKEQATVNGEPYIEVTRVSVNPENPRSGFFEFDWNTYFIQTLKKNGYTGITDDEVVAQWFNELCRTIGEEEEIPGGHYTAHIDPSVIRKAV